MLASVDVAFAAFPSVLGEQTTVTGGALNNITSHVVNYPSGDASGDRYVAAAQCDANNATDISWPAGWTELDQINSTTRQIGSIAYRDADGSEGTTFTVTTNFAENCVTHVWLLDAGTFHSSTAPSVSSDTTGSNSTTYDFPALTPAGGARDYLWLLSLGYDSSTASSVISTFPSNYGNTGQAGGTGGDLVTAGWARRELNASSEDPGGGTLSTTGRWTAFTIAIRPADAAPPTFSGTIANQTPTEGSAITAIAGSSFFSSGAAPTSYSMQGCTLPAGISLNTSTGEISGTPTAPVNVTGCMLRGTNAAGSTNSNTFNWTIGPPSNKQYVTLTSVSGTSWCADFNTTATPDIAAGDIVKIDSATDPSDFAVNVLADCNLSYSGDSSRQRIQYDVYDASASAYMTGGPGNLWFNNQAPVPEQAESMILLDVGAAFSNDLCALFSDAEEDVLSGSNSSTGTGTGSNKHPAGTSFSNCTWSGTATTEATGQFTFTATDIAGDAGSALVKWEAIDTVTVPDLVGNEASEAVLTLQAAHLSHSLSHAYSDTVAAGSVIKQSPIAATEVEPLTAVALTVSQGPPYASGEFTGTLTGVSGSVTTTLRYTRFGPLVAIYIPQVSGTSNATTLTVTGLPIGVHPARVQQTQAIVRNNSAVSTSPGLVRIDTDGLLTFFSSTAQAGFSATGTKGLELQTLYFTMD
jgi:large repetitive protein